MRMTSLRSLRVKLAKGNLGKSRNLSCQTNQDPVRREETESIYRRTRMRKCRSFVKIITKIRFFDGSKWFSLAM